MAYPELNDGEIAQIVALFTNDEKTVVSQLQGLRAAQELLEKIQGEQNFVTLWQILTREQYALLLRRTLFVDPPAAGVFIPAEALAYFLQGDECLATLVHGDKDLAVLFFCSNQEYTQAWMLSLAFSGRSKICSLEALLPILKKNFSPEELNRLLESLRDKLFFPLGSFDSLSVGRRRLSALGLALAADRLGFWLVLAKGEAPLCELYLQLRVQNFDHEQNFRQALAAASFEDLRQFLQAQDKGEAFDLVVMFDNALECGQLLQKIQNRTQLLAMMSVLHPVQRRRLVASLSSYQFERLSAVPAPNESVDATLSLALSLPLSQAYVLLKPLAGRINFERAKLELSAEEKLFLDSEFERFSKRYKEKNALFGVVFDGEWLEIKEGETGIQRMIKILRYALAQNHKKTISVLQGLLPADHRVSPRMLSSLSVPEDLKEQALFMAMLPPASFSAHLESGFFSRIFSLALWEAVECLPPARRDSCRSAMVRRLEKSDFRTGELANAEKFLAELLSMTEIPWGRRHLLCDLAKLFARLESTHSSYYQLFEKLLAQGLPDQVRGNTPYLEVFRLVLAPQCFEVLYGYYVHTKNFVRTKQMIVGFGGASQDGIARFFLRLPKAAYPYYLKTTVNQIQNAQDYVTLYNSFADNLELTAWIFHISLEQGTLYKMTEEKNNLKLVLGTLSCEQFSAFFGMYPDRFDWVGSVQMFAELMRVFNPDRHAAMLSFIKDNKFFGDLPVQYETGAVGLEDAPVVQSIPESDAPIQTKGDLLRLLMGDNSNKESLLLDLAKDSLRWEQLLKSDCPRLPVNYLSYFLHPALNLPIWRTVELLRSFGVKIDFERDVPRDFQASGLCQSQRFNQELPNFQGWYAKTRSQNFTLGLLPKLAELNSGRQYWKIVAHALKAKPDSATSQALLQMKQKDLSESQGLYAKTSDCTRVLLFIRDESLDQSQSAHEVTGNDAVSGTIPNSRL